MSIQMNKRTHQLFVRQPADDANERIIAIVMVRIQKRRITHARLVAWTNGTIAILSLAAIAPAVGYLMNSANQSGFFEYSSLLISDTSTVMHSWSTFAISIADSAPIVGIIAVIATIFILAASARSLVKSMAILSMRHAI